MSKDKKEILPEVLPEVLPEGPCVDPSIAAWSACQQSASIAYASSNDIVLRCLENGIAVPQSWTSYRKQLRAIIESTKCDQSKTLPTAPALPKGI